MNENIKNLKILVDQDMELFKYLSLKLTNKSKNNIKSLLIKEHVLVDEKIITKYNYLVRKGQIITIKTAQINNKAIKNNIDIIYEDKDLIVINKPAGLLSIATKDEKNITAYKMVREYIKKNNKGLKIFVVHRLDKDTSGILVFAKNENIKHLLQENWDTLVKVRGYIAIVEGNLDKPNNTIVSWLKETKTMLVYSSFIPNDGQKAITHYQTIKSNHKYTMLSINIDTGRKNQIRVHMKDIGHNIIGDKKYGSKLNPIGRLGLHANRLEFINPINKKTIHLEADLPSEFNNIFKN